MAVKEYDIHSEVLVEDGECFDAQALKDFDEADFYDEVVSLDEFDGFNDGLMSDF